MMRLAILAALAVTAAASARVPSTKTVLLPQPGARGDITVPYTTNGFSTLGVANGVSPAMFAAPKLDSAATPKMQNVYNLIYYGSRLGSSSPANAATPREPNNLRGNQLGPKP
jgi:hypothetical protein